MKPISVGLGIQACKLVFAGLCLSIGFWGGKKITNKIDMWLYTHSDEFKEFVKQKRKEAEVGG